MGILVCVACEGGTTANQPNSDVSGTASGSGGAATGESTGANGGSQGASDGTGGSSGSGFENAGAGSGGEPPVCDCDDGIACTLDTCEEGECEHLPRHFECSITEYCSSTEGSVDGAVCATDDDCMRPDNCVTTRCDASTRRCLFFALDGDGDQVPPEVCGGGDCDDDDFRTYAGAPEICDGRDNDCDGLFDLPDDPVCDEQTSTGGSSGSGGSGGSSGSGGSTGSPEASCEDPTPPCGGNLVGTWVVADSCVEVSGEVDMTLLGVGCDSGTVTGMLQVSGTWSADAEGNFSDETVTTGESTVTLPPECLEVSGTTTTCGVLGSVLRTLGFASATCQADDATEGCICTATVDQAGGLGFVSEDVSESGTYSTAGDQLTLSYASDVDYSYCVSRDTLHITPSTVARTGTVMGEIVLQRQ